MTSFFQRAVGAAMLNANIYEEVEADRGATGQAMLVIVLASIGGGIGIPGLGPDSVGAVVAGVVSALIGWLAWAALTYIIGTRILPEPQTRADVGELLRTIGFAASPGVLRVLGIIPGLGPIIYLAVSIWMLVAMIVAVRQALDFTSTGRAIAVCAVGWGISLVVAAILGLIFTPTVS